MAYTYDEFISAATGAGMLDKFSEEDLNIAKLNPEYGMSALKLQQDLQGAGTTEQKLLAQEAINQLRKSYGTVNNNAVGGSFTYGNETAYQKALNDVVNQQPFQYDAAKDPSYGALKKSYLREGDRAREDTLARVSAATGGTPSSFAVTAAQQAGDYYSGKLADAMPAMEQNAYQRYLSDFEQKLGVLDALNTDRNFSYSKYLQDYENAKAMYKELGYATPEIAKILGLPVAENKTGSNSVYQNTLNNEIITQLKAAYPGGVVSDEKTWNDLIGQYGAGLVQAAGLSYSPVNVPSSGIDTTRNQNGMKGSAWDYTKNNLAGLLRNGNVASAERYMEMIVDQVSEKQFDELLGMLANAGYKVSG